MKTQAGIHSRMFRLLSSMTLVQEHIAWIRANIVIIGSFTDSTCLFYTFVIVLLIPFKNIDEEGVNILFHRLDAKTLKNRPYENNHYSCTFIHGRI
jgi:hypothetical protein